MSTLLVIDDSPSTLHIFNRLYADGSVKVLTAPSGQLGVETVNQYRPDVVILDVILPDLSGLETFQRIRRIDPKLPVIFITAGASSETAIEAMKLGAYDYLTKPLNLGQVRHLVSRALELRRLMHVPVRMTATEDGEVSRSDALVGRCPSMQEVYKAIGLVAPQDVTVLIQGETGTGKELIARAIYQHGRRAGGPFLAVNCAAIPETLLESELFGHERGAFTGADRRRIGKFEQSSGGTLFLDEIGDMTPITQSKLLRVLQEQRFERLGGEETLQTDVRIIAATNRNLEALVSEGRFRGDLYYRLNVFSIMLPPLRERGDDLPLLVEHYLKRFSREFSKDVTGTAPDTLEMLMQYHWPGNVRELQSVLKQALLRATGPVLVKDFLPPTIRENRPPVPAGTPMLTPAFGALPGGPSNASGGNATTGGAGGTHPAAEPGTDWIPLVDRRLNEGSENLYEEWMECVERPFLVHVLRRMEGNQFRAAKVLGINRTTLRNKLRALGIVTHRDITDSSPPTG